jgi:hypothetical protein
LSPFSWFAEGKPGTGGGEPGVVHALCCEEVAGVQGGRIYQVRIGGHLDPQWSRRLGNLTLTHEPDGTTMLIGPLADQPALHGLLNRIRDLGLELISVQRVSAPGPTPGL